MELEASRLRVVEVLEPVKIDEVEEVELVVPLEVEEVLGAVEIDEVEEVGVIVPLEVEEVLPRLVVLTFEVVEAVFDVVL